jgi:hypothetical protein
MTTEYLPDENRTASILDGDACRRMLASQEVGRVAMQTLEGLVVLPVNYAVANRTIVFRTSAGGVLGAAARDGRAVAFQVDSFDRMARYGWTVLARGELRTATLASSLDTGERSVDTWLHKDDPVIAVIEVESVAGRSLPFAPR